MYKQACFLGVIAFAGLLGCGGATPDTTLDSTDSSADALVGDGALGSDVALDASESATAPRRLACLDSSALATDLPGDAYGALEGELVSIVPPGTRGCPSDSDHLHLQIAVGTKRYDVAITINDNTGAGPMAYFEKDLPPKSQAPGWLSGGFDFVANLGAHAAAFSSADAATLLGKLKSTLAEVSLLRVHGRAYTDGTGMHDVHYNRGGRDGVLMLHGKGAAGADHVIAVRFSTDSF